jgi:hypothetical protein
VASVLQRCGWHFLEKDCRHFDDLACRRAREGDAKEPPARERGQQLAKDDIHRRKKTRESRDETRSVRRSVLRGRGEKRVSFWQRLFCGKMAKFSNSKFAISRFPFPLLIIKWADTKAHARSSRTRRWRPFADSQASHTVAFSTKQPEYPLIFSQ